MDFNSMHRNRLHALLEDYGLDGELGPEEIRLKLLKIELRLKQIEGRLSDVNEVQGVMPRGRHR